MKKYYLSSDIGSVLVGNKDFGVALPNIGGDGTTMLLIVDHISEIKSEYNGSYEFFNCIEGKFNVYRDDCSERDDEDIVATIDGRYGVYRGDMLVVLEKWD